MIRKYLKYGQIALFALGGDPSTHVRSFAFRWLRRLLSGVPSAWTQPPEHFEFLSGTPDEAGYQPITGSVLLCGDAQIHHFAGRPDSTSNFLDPWSEPAVRPALQGFFGDRLLTSLLREHLSGQDHEGVIFLGDALNTSCETELERFEVALQRVVGPQGSHPGVSVAVIPGNHDGLLYGNLGAGRPPVRIQGNGSRSKLLRWMLNRQWPEWESRCSVSDRSQPTTVDRNRFQDFLAGLISQPPSSSGNDSSAPEPWYGWTHRGLRLQRLDRPDGGLLRLALRYVDRESPHRSFLVQVLELPGPVSPRRTDPKAETAQPRKVLAIALDTTNFSARPRAAGLVGSISRTQQIVARVAVDLVLAQRDGKIEVEPPALILLGHHNIQALTRSSRWLLTHLFISLRDAKRVEPIPLYISAHRHRGGWYAHAIDEHALSMGEQVRWMDLNVSSLVDWPLATRSLRIWEAGSRRIRPYLVESRLRRAADPGELEAPVPELVRRAQKIGRRDAVSHRHALLRQSVFWRLRSMAFDAERDAHCADYAFNRAGARTLIGLHRTVADSLASELPHQFDRLLLDLNLSAEGLVANATGRPMKMFKEWAQDPAGWRGQQIGLQFALLRYRECLLRIVDASPVIEKLICDAVVWSALEDKYQQWQAHGDLPVGIGERWYREATNIEESHALLPIARARDSRLLHGRVQSVLQFAGRPGSFGTRTAEWYALSRASGQWLSTRPANAAGQSKVDPPCPLAVATGSVPAEDCHRSPHQAPH